MKHLITALLATITILLSSCGPDTSEYKLTNLPNNNLGDTIPTIVMGGPVDSTIEEESKTVITIFQDSITVESDIFKTTKRIDVANLYVKVGENGKISYVQVNQLVLLAEACKKEGKVNHNYLYLDGNTIQVLEGNALDAIVQDHLDQGYDISRTKILSYNKYLLNRGGKIRVGDIVRLAPEVK